LSRALGMFFLLIFVFVQSAIGSSYDLISHTYSTVSSGKDSVLILPHSFLISGKEEVYVDSTRLISLIDYRIDYIHGILYFSHVPDSGKGIFVFYQSFPFALFTEYTHRSFPDSTQVSLPQKAATPQKMTRSSGISFSDELQKSGSIFRGIQIGTDQGLQLQSGLRLQVSGQIAPKVEVVASLTDQNTPIQPEGNTQTLQEIDKVFVQVRAPGIGITMGDYNYENTTTEFGKYSRKLQGALGKVEGERGSISAWIATSKGQFATNHFNGMEGNQGPYALVGANGERDIIVLAGTERVWINGEPMIRGEDQDYVIDYSTGQITFTRRRLITSDSRITVDFEYSAQNFQKTISGISGQTRLANDRITLFASFFREADDKEHPLDISLTQNEKEVLARAGDNPDSAVTSGARYVGEGQGNYIRVETPEGPVYQYVGNLKGDYRLYCSYVGQGKGSYSLQGYGIYRYEGPGKGAYLPVIFLPLATSHYTGNFAVRLDPGKDFFFENEIGMSTLDQNLYSPLDDKDNTGFAYTAQLGRTKSPFYLHGKRMGVLGFKGKARSIDSKFRPLSRMSEVEHGRKWGMAEGKDWGESISELTFEYAPVTPLEFVGELGTFQQHAFSSTRMQWEAAFSHSEASKNTFFKYIPEFRYRIERISTQQNFLEGFWIRQYGQINPQWKWISPSFFYESEHRKNADPDSGYTGFRFDEWTGLVVFNPKVFSFQMEEKVRLEDVYRSARLCKNSLARTHTFRFDVKSDPVWTGSLLLTRRNRDYTRSSQQDQATDLAEMHFGLSPWDRVLDMQVNYRYSSTQVSEMVRDTIRIGAGLGNYRYDSSLGEYVPDPDGDVIFRMFQTGRFLPVNDLEGEMQIQIEGMQLKTELPKKMDFVKNLRFYSYFRTERRDKAREFQKVNLRAFQPHWGKDSTLVTGAISFQEDLEYTDTKKGFSFRMRWRGDDSESHQFLEEGTFRKFRQWAIRLKGNPFPQWGILAEMEKQTERKEYFSQFRTDRNIHAYGVVLEASFRPQTRMEWALKAKFRQALDREPEPDSKGMALFWFPRFSYAFNTKGQFRTELEWGHVFSEPRGRTLPYEMFGGDQPGRTIRLNVLFNYRVTSHILATFSYRGRKEPWREKFFHSGQLEMRAFF